MLLIDYGTQLMRVSTCVLIFTSGYLVSGIVTCFDKEDLMLLILG